MLIEENWFFFQRKIDTKFLPWKNFIKPKLKLLTLIPIKYKLHHQIHDIKLYIIFNQIFSQAFPFWSA